MKRAFHTGERKRLGYLISTSEICIAVQQRYEIQNNNINLMKRTLTLIVMALVVATMPAVAQNAKQMNEAISRAGELMKEARYGESEKIIDSLLVINPNNSDALYLRCNTLLDNLCYDEALDYCNRAIEHRTSESYYDASYLYYCQGCINVLLKKYNDAVAGLSRALEFAEETDEQQRVRIHYTLAKCYSDIGDYAKAEDNLMTALMSDNGDMRADITLALANTCYKGQEYERSIMACNALIEMWEYPAEAYRIGAHSLIKMHCLEAAIDTAILMAKMCPESIEERELTEMLWYDVKYAREKLRESIANDEEQYFRGSHFLMALFTHDYETIISLLDTMGDVLTPDQIAFNRADYSAKAGRYDDAVRYITEHIDKQDAALDIYYLTTARCAYYHHAGYYAEALADADRLVELMPDMVYGYYMQGEIYELMGDDAKAMECYNEAIEVDNSHAHAYLARGKQYLKCGDTERAKADFERVLELDTEVADGSVRHYALHFLGRDAEAEAWCDKLIEFAPYACDTYYSAACLYARMGDVERALDSLRFALYFGYKAKAHIENDDDLDPIRHTETSRQLMVGYFNE